MYSTMDPDNDYSHEPDEREQFFYPPVTSSGETMLYEAICNFCGASYGDKLPGRIDEWEEQHIKECNGT